ncbi:sulfite exporter TauE/SafE family protein [Variovorax saccharolyticus]|uniref:sulfite exporter TauE/SafE family protein n=1 Tax=Variovorax saccharolyticus TaxID=3053516 RepID=UPI0025755237|nr:MULTISPECIES: TSUP family transporter [unclassified Variovorax]MDM0017229.1 TSUP family transporter [Variovorax sp. J22R187]MDM0026749.1 TSUP family transporter [Variovorax sp. J31P216]
MEVLVLTLASLFAGFIDSIVGGGGLILVPALFSVLPGTAPATLLGTNKSASVWGTAAAAAQFHHRVGLRWHTLLPAGALAFAGSLAGAWAVTVVPGDFLRKLLPLVLVALLLYTLARKDLGHHHAPRFSGRAELLATCSIGVLLGLYDGFFGPGTGSFFVFLFVRWLGYDFLNAAGSAKLLNTMTNLGALLLFGLKGHVLWPLALTMAVANVAGSVIGARVAIRHGAVFVRKVFIVVVGALILKTAYDAFFR